MKYQFIRRHSKEHPTVRLCEVFGVSTSGCYDWLDRPDSERSKENRRLTQRIRFHHEKSHGIYELPKIHRDLIEEGNECNRPRVARLMKQALIQSKLRRNFVTTTDSKTTTQPAPDRLKRQFEVTAPNTVWVSDTTLIPT